MRKRRPKGFPKNLCSKCGNPLEANRIGKQRYCLKCHATYMRATRPSYEQLSIDQQKKVNARAYFNQYVKRGLIHKQPCEVCGADAQGHHENYDKPLDVIWLCRRHHLEHHKKEDNGNKSNKQ